MHIYITNLKTSTDRRQHMEKQLKEAKLSYQFFDCVIGADLSEEEVSQKCDIESIRKQNDKVNWFTRGVIGCTMTNQNIYNDIINRNLDYVLFLEDDTVIPTNLSSILDYIEPRIKQGDVLLLFWKAWEPLKLDIPIIETPFQTNFYIPLNHEVLTGGSAYIVTKKAAQKMIEVNTPIQTPPDNWKFYYQNKCIDRLICAYPHVVGTADFKSTMRAGKFLFLRELIEKYKIFPLYQILKLKRKRSKEETLKVEFINQKE